MKILPGKPIPYFFALACLSSSLTACTTTDKNSIDDVAAAINEGSAGLAFIGAQRTPLGILYLSGNQSGINAGATRTSGRRKIKPAPGQVAMHARYDVIRTTVYSAPELSPSALKTAETSARMLAIATGEVWPGQPVPIELEFIAHDPNPGKYRSSIKIKRKKNPWRLKFFVQSELLHRPDTLSHPGKTAAHELYHLLAVERRIGDSDRRSALPKASRRLLEEIAATGFGHCAQLLAGEPADARDMPNITVEVRDETGSVQELPAPLPDEWVLKYGHAIEAGQDVEFLLYLALNLTLWMDISGGSRIIQPHSLEADRLLAFCNETAPEPENVIGWLRAIGADGIDARVAMPR